VVQCDGAREIFTASQAGDDGVENQGAADIDKIGLRRAADARTDAGERRGLVLPRDRSDLGVLGEGRVNALAVGERTHG
jgi:hypothetical protein